MALKFTRSDLQTLISKHTNCTPVQCYGLMEALEKTGLIKLDKPNELNENSFYYKKQAETNESFIG
ncbi:MAG: hypothetical protein WAQ53_10630 [Thiofilum sp.]|uniref:hypothetical protein n=1 Tax=Thiofilum sp. TaxID=2212733 RepID=UPI0025FF1459|nr:hypothetical protein [Thiofilum sp.]MBK8453316.1 hypothetical protein [Thiofilum sp.]